MSDGKIRCPGCGSAEVAGWQITGVYDGVLFWACQQGCGGVFHRWAEGTRLWRDAEKYMGNMKRAVAQ